MGHGHQSSIHGRWLPDRPIKASTGVQPGDDSGVTLMTAYKMPMPVGEPTPTQKSQPGAAQ
jgi:hypothetical protein